jgi:murein DD-endopeptidase MepM/ murein hydrolase activator NlpD
MTWSLIRAGLIVVGVSTSAASTQAVATGLDSAQVRSVVDRSTATRAALVASSRPVYRAPVAGPLVVRRRFEPPPTMYAAGHRGVDLATTPDEAVLAAGAGQVSFAGDVAGRGVVVILHPDGISTEYEPVTPLVRPGQTVRMGQVIARIRGGHHGCPPDRCLHWGARRAGRYLDPLLLLRPLGPVRLLPWLPSVRAP